MTVTVRVYELAKKLGVGSAEVIADLQELGYVARSASSSVPIEFAIQVEAKRGASAPAANNFDDLRALVSAAFEAARRAGRIDWQTMSVAVLKNRLLDLTDRSFDERAYGARNMVEFAAALPGVVSLDTAAKPARVTLLQADAAAVAAALPALSARTRIRSDLWHAVLDTDAFGLWAYTAEGDVVRLEDPPHADTDLLILPTASAADLVEWRREFATDMSRELAGRVDDLEKLMWWSGRKAPSTYLPASARGAWNRHLKTRVVERLTTWFGDNNLTVPANLLLSEDAESARPPRPHTRSQGLRQYLLACLDAMTDAELAGVIIPVTVAYRLSAGVTTHPAEPPSDRA